MMICHCRAVRANEIREVIGAGIVELDQIAAVCGAGSKCGGCREAVAELVGEVAIVPRGRLCSAGA
jgi:bacterioferritin-associated ferredoxin